MKLMTLNTHSLVESSYEEKRKFIETLIVEQPDVVALQETASAGIIPDVMLAEGVWISGFL